MNLLQVSDLHVYYGSIHAIKGISFEVKSGEIVSLIGANGAGKTTCLKTISGLLPYRGNIQLKGQNIDGTPAYQRVSLGLSQSPEGRGVFPQMTVLENIELGAYSRSNRESIQKDLENCFQLFPRLKERKTQLAGTLSGGEQQMLAISRALMAKPQVLLLDEPSLGLAPKIVSQIFEIITQLNSEGITILLVEQNARMALKISTRAYVLETGEITLTGSGLELYNNEDVQRGYLG